MEKIGNRYGLAASYLNLGIVCTEQGDLMRALRYCNLAMDIVYKVPYYPDMGEVHHILADIDIAIVAIILLNGPSFC
jgi:hypothetical protein